ncbi:Putative electron transfer flavoprotein subunit [Saitoella coloradoensis]
MSQKLRILTPVKRVLDYALKPRVNKTQTAVDIAGMKQSLNPFDEIAVEEAIRLREKHKDRVEDILAASIGPVKAQDCLRTAMAMGADRSAHIEVPESEAPEPLAIAKILKALVEKEGSNVVILGKQAIDDDSQQTGQMLAGLLGWSQATCAAEVKVEGDEILVTREVDGGTETVKAQLPIIITTDLRLNEPRFATLPNIMKAKKKPMQKLKPSDLNVEYRKSFELLKVQEPPTRQGGAKVGSVDEVVAKLKEAGVI